MKWRGYAFVGISCFCAGWGVSRRISPNFDHPEAAEKTSRPVAAPGLKTEKPAAPDEVKRIRSLESQLQQAHADNQRLDSRLKEVARAAEAATTGPVETQLDANGNLLFKYDRVRRVLTFDPKNSVVLKKQGEIFVNKGEEIAGGLKSENTGVPATLKFENERNEDVLLFWINYEGQPVLYDQIAPGGASNRPTGIGHPWVVTDLQGNRLGDVAPEHPSQTEVIPVTK